MPLAKRRWSTRPRARFVVGLLLVAWVLVAGTLSAGGGPWPVKGKVLGWERLLPQIYADSSKPDSHRFTWREPSPTVKQDFRKLSASVTRDVCIAAFGAAAAGVHEPRAVRVTGGRITPSTIVISPGTRLSFKNADPFAHELYEVSNASWAANAVAPGSSREWAATTAGRVTCPRRRRARTAPDAANAAVARSGRRASAAIQAATDQPDASNTAKAPGCRRASGAAVDP